MVTFTTDYLLDKKVTIYQPKDGYRASIDAVFLAAAVPESKVKKGDSILDVGAGTGAISLCLSRRLKEKNINITGLEIQEQLVELANMSAKENGFAETLHFEKTDIRQKTSLVPGSYHFVITNPPYSDHDMPSPNLSKKLAHNHQNFDLTGWLTFCLKMLKPKGYILLINRTEAINEILSAMHNKAGALQILPIYSKRGQKSKRIIVIAQKGAKGITQILSPFYIHEDDGKYTAQAEDILRQGCGIF